MKYIIPEKYYMRLHHVRPRFKGRVEEVLLYVSSAINEIGQRNVYEFNSELVKRIYEFPGNATKSNKTIQNWRTEISALFALYYEDIDGIAYPGAISTDLSNNQDLTKFFKYFLHSFQYPGGHIKPSKITEMLSKNVLFHPASFFVRILLGLQTNYGNQQAYITKAEATHCCFNDLRATSGDKDPVEIASLIADNRTVAVEYDCKGDVVRYAGDILDYMEYANFLKNYQGKYYLNNVEKKAIDVLLSEKERYYYPEIISPDQFRELEISWFKYANKFIRKNIYETDVLAFIAEDDKDYKELCKRTEYIKQAEIPQQGFKAIEIGNYGENIVYGHECMRLKLGNREDLIRFVQCIPNQLALGYDIQSIKLDETKKYIEVKSTISNRSFTFNKFKMTKNELATAQTLGKNYYVYRLHLSRNKITMHIIQNPIGLFKQGKIDIDIVTGEVALRKYFGVPEDVLKWG